MHNERLFPYGHARDADWRTALSSTLEMAGPWVRGGTLGFLYVSDSFESDLPEILSALREETGVPHWTGCVGIGICATAQEYLDEPALALMVTDFPETAFHLFAGLEPYQPGKELTMGEADHPPYFAIVHGDSRTPDLPDLVRDFAGKMRSGFITGGISSSRANGAQLADTVVHDGLSGVTFSEKIAIVTRLTQGCSPIGPIHQIAEAKSNVIARLDDRPALDVFYEEIGDILSRDLQRAAGFIFVALPVKNDDRGDYMVRNLLGIDIERKLLAIGEYVETGQSLMFCKRDGSSAREDMERMLTEITRLVGGRRIRGGLYFSCLGRGEGLFGPDSMELRIIQERLDDFPLVGFFANGEISHDKIYGYTGVLTLFLDAPVS
ncbi:histidine kinase [Acidithiobacillus ferrivorans]|uniref:Histidine kinase n=1 Tax=Acidithiobacillus ferrivorans TaxID=160808 RepID=A0A1B9BZK5_9PROT|nr:FIST N-terminal domain-containing protein [Acidithiobacillus ferrivorans]OCB03155.1 histidine kinase [Acidithiobacillus ferrivorans]